MNWHAVGWVKDAHGLKGELYIQLFAKKADWLKDLTTFTLKNKTSGEEKTYQSKRTKPHKLGLIIWPEEFKDRNQSEAVKGFTFLIPKEILVSPDALHPYLIEIEGFGVVDATLGAIGVVRGFEYNGAQDLLVVDYQGREVLIPFVDELIQKFDRSNKTIQMDLPPGLLDED
jgi:16S rRNA processing protein RimM